jgi:GNAT superfamily N-acetyltransferase
MTTITLCRQTDFFRVAQATRLSRSRVRSCLSHLPLLYPKAETWIDRVLDRIERGSSTCYIASLGQSPVGLWIETSKGLRTQKISTIYVRPTYRGLGLGDLLLRSAERGWAQKGTDLSYVTVPGERRELICPWLLKRKFRWAAVDAGRYGCERDEIVLRRQLP